METITKKIMKTTKIIHLSLLFGALMLASLAQAQIKVKEYAGNGKWNVTKVYTPPPLQFTKEQLIENLNKDIKHIQSVYDGNDYFRKGIRALDDRFETKEGTFFYYADFLIGDSIELYVSKSYSKGVFLPVIRPRNKYFPYASFDFSSSEYARDFAENMYYIFKSYHDKELALTKADSIQFSIAVEKYRELKEKPTVSEEQRKYIVQANMFNEEKNYSKAIELYKRTIEINPVAYPVAYYNMALLYAQEKNFRQAIFNMKKYLLLMPDAPDARAAQDKIYGWEAKL